MRQFNLTELPTLQLLLQKQIKLKMLLFLKQTKLAKKMLQHLPQTHLLQLLIPHLLEMPQLLMPLQKATKLLPPLGHPHLMPQSKPIPVPQRIMLLPRQIPLELLHKVMVQVNQV